MSINFNSVSLSLNNLKQSNNNQNTSSHAQNVTETSKKEKKFRWENFLISDCNLALIIMCACALIQNIIVGGANNAILTTIERAYFMTSIESAMFLSFYDFANILASPVIGFYGDRCYKPKILGISMIGLGIGSFMMALPEFITNDSPDLLIKLISNS